MFLLIGSMSISWKMRHSMSWDVASSHFSCIFKKANLAPMFISFALLNRASSSCSTIKISYYDRHTSTYFIHTYINHDTYVSVIELMVFNGLYIMWQVFFTVPEWHHKRRPVVWAIVIFKWCLNFMKDFFYTVDSSSATSLLNNSEIILTLTEEVKWQEWNKTHSNWGGEMTSPSPPGLNK